MEDSCPNYLGALLHMRLAYLPKFDSLALFGHPSAGDRLNYGLTKFRGKRAVAPKSEQQTATIDRK
jgi:hypothetical protein